MSFTYGAIWTSLSSQDPSGQGGFTGAGNIWVQTDTGLWFVRNSSNTGWTAIGSGDQSAFGLVPLSGAALSGAITGATNLMTADGATPFAVPPTITSKSSVAASLYDLSQVQANLQLLITETVAQQVSSIPVPGLRSNMAFKEGQILIDTTISANYAQVLSLPFAGMVYPDGTAVAQGDCYGIASQALNNWISNNGDALTLTLTPADTRGMSWQCWCTRVGTANWPGNINYQIIAIKPNA